MSDVRTHHSAPVALGEAAAIYARGIVSFFHEERGWGLLVSPTVDGEVWVKYDVIDCDGFQNLHPGERIEFRYVRTALGGGRNVAVWVRTLDD